VLYPDGVTPVLSPAYDVVAYAAYLGGRGHALRFHPGAPERAQITPALVRDLCNRVGLVETKVKAVLADAVERARTLWPAMIKDSALTDAQRSRLLEHFHQVPAVQAQARRSR
jgi:serine/threonine-protein kinase HipA